MTHPKDLLDTVLDEREAQLAKTAQCSLMAALDYSRAAKIVLLDSDRPAGHQAPTLELPPKALRLIAELLGQMAQRQPIALIPQEFELSTQDAAAILNVSRPFVVKEIEAGHLAHRKVGRHRRVRFEDLIVYQKKMRHEAQQALQELADQAQELNLGY